MRDDGCNCTRSPAGLRASVAPSSSRPSSTAFQNVRGMPAVLGRTFFLSKSGSPFVGQSWMKWPGFWQRWHT